MYYKIMKRTCSTPQRCIYEPYYIKNSIPSIKCITEDFKQKTIHCNPSKFNRVRARPDRQTNRVQKHISAMLETVKNESYFVNFM